LLIRQRTVIASLHPGGPAIGVISEAKFRVEEIKMKENDLLVAFTDGIPDTLNLKNEPFGTDRLTKLLHGNDATLNEMLKNIEAQISLHIGTAEQFDDISLLVVKRHK
jgi:serine phosphatase RsbU (regulator of sigma subunit)